MEWLLEIDSEDLEETTCMHCKSLFYPYLDFENEMLEIHWCKTCADSGEFLCFVIADTPPA